MAKVKVNEQLSYLSANHDDNLIYTTIKERIDCMAETRPDKVAYIFAQNNGLEITYKSLKESVYTMAENYLRLNLQKGDRVALLLPNTSELLLSAFAASLTGIIIVPLDPNIGSEKIKYMLDKTTPSLLMLFDSDAYKNIANDLFPELKDLKAEQLNLSKFKYISNVLMVTPNGKKLSDEFNANIVHSYENFSRGPINKMFVQLPVVQADDVFGIIFTSGTTSKPKGVTVTQFTVTNVQHIQKNAHLFKSDRACCLSTLLYHEAAISLSLLPLFYDNFVIVYPSYGLDIDENLKSIEKYKCSVWIVYTKMLVDILHHADRDKHDLSSVFLLTAVGSHLSPQYMLKTKQLLPSLFGISYSYGMTEVNPVSVGFIPMQNFTPENFKLSLGYMFPFIECKVVSPETNLIVPFGQSGELFVRAFNATPGYWNDEAQSREAFDSNRWYKTGDIVSMDRDGLMYFKCRKQDIIKTKTSDVYHTDIEEALIQNENVVEAIAFGLQDQQSGDATICAWVKRKPESIHLTEQMLIDFCAAKLSPNQVPKHIKFVDSFPLSTMSKYLRSTIKLDYQKELENLKL